MRKRDVDLIDIDIAKGLAWTVAKAVMEGDWETVADRAEKLAEHAEMIMKED